MTDAISDNAAIEFSRFFYRALAEKADIGRAVEQARFGDPGKLAERSRRHARPELRARFCVDDNGFPEVWEDGGETVFVPFDLFIENAPSSASSVIYRLHESYNESADSPEQGQFHEVTGADDDFYLHRVDSEDDYTVEAYLRWNSGGVRVVKRRVTEALSAYYKSLSAEALACQLVDIEVIGGISKFRRERVQLRWATTNRPFARCSSRILIQVGMDDCRHAEESARRARAEYSSTSTTLDRAIVRRSRQHRLKRVSSAPARS